MPRSARAVLIAVSLTHILSGGIAQAAKDPLSATMPASSGNAPAGLANAVEKYFKGGDGDYPARRIFRLTRDQIDITVRHLLPTYFKASVKTAMPRDQLQTNYEFADLLTFNAANVDGLKSWVHDLAMRVRAEPKQFIDCEVRLGDECLREKAARFIASALRGDGSQVASAKLVDYFVNTARSQGVPRAAADLVEAVLTSPDFLFRKEIEINKRGRVTPQQHLQAITYMLADAPPEKLGMGPDAALTYVQTPGDVAAVIDAVLASRDAREKLVRFFRAWLEIKDPDEFTISSEVFPEFTPKVAGDLIGEAEQFLRAAIEKPAPTLKDITQPAQSPISKTLASLKADSPDDPARRFGIFTAPAVIASHSGPTGTRLVKRGVFWVRKVMCMELEPPPKNLHIDVYALEGVTDREKIEEGTRQATCIGCHKIINPFGFMLEHYDAIGRWREKDNGEAVDTAIKFGFLDEGPQKTTTPVEALKVFTGSVMFKQCFVRQVFRYYMGRDEEPSDDPLLGRMFLAFTENDGQDILGLLKILASSDRISRRQ